MYQFSLGSCALVALDWGWNLLFFLFFELGVGGLERSMLCFLCLELGFNLSHTCYMHALQDG